eukprot:g12834.t1
MWQLYFLWTVEGSWCQALDNTCSGQRHNLVKQVPPTLNGKGKPARFLDWDGDGDTDALVKDGDGGIWLYERLANDTFDKQALVMFTPVEGQTQSSLAFALRRRQGEKTPLVKRRHQFCKEWALAFKPCRRGPDRSMTAGKLQDFLQFFEAFIKERSIIENRQWIVAAIEQVEAARSMDLSAVADGNGKIYESNCDFRDSPATKTERNGTFSIVGDVVTFNAPQRTITTEGAGGTFTETKEEVERLRFRVKANQLLQLKGDTDEVGTISGGIAGDPQPAVLNKSS